MLTLAFTLKKQGNLKKCKG